MMLQGEACDDEEGCFVCFVFARHDISIEVRLVNVNGGVRWNCFVFGCWGDEMRTIDCGESKLSISSSALSV